MVDIHSHMLQGIFDSPPGIEGSLEMAESYERHGFAYVVSAPHYIPADEKIGSFLDKCEKKYIKLDDAMKKAGIRIDIIRGAEVTLCPELLRRGDIRKLCIAGTNYMLVELPWHTLNGVRELLFELELRNITPIAAHPERNFYIQKNVNELLDMAERGLLIQVDAFSFFEGGATKKCADKLLESRVVAFLATDAHRADHRISCFNDARSIIRKKLGDIAEKRIMNNSLLCISQKKIDGDGCQ